MTTEPDSAPKPLVKIWFPLPPEEGGGAETMWAEPLDRREPFVFRLMNIPLYVFGIGNGDLIEARIDEDSALTFVRVVGRGGHSTYRVALRPDAPRERAAALTDRLLIGGVGIERSSERFFAVDIPAAVDIHTIYDILREGLDDGTWWYDEMHVGHP